MNDTITYITDNKGLVFTLVIVLGGFIGSEIVLSSVAVNALDYKPELCENLFSVINNKAYGI